MAIKRTTTEVSVPANSSVDGNILTNDENVSRTLVGVFVGTSTPDVTITIDLSGNPQFSMDCSEFSNTKGLVECSIAFPINTRIHYTIQNDTGGALNDLPINIAYMV